MRDANLAEFEQSERVQKFSEAELLNVRYQWRGQLLQLQSTNCASINIAILFKSTCHRFSLFEIDTAFWTGLSINVTIAFAIFRNQEVQLWKKTWQTLAKNVPGKWQSNRADCDFVSCKSCVVLPRVLQKEFHNAEFFTQEVKCDAV